MTKSTHKRCQGRQKVRHPESVAFVPNKYRHCVIFSYLSHALERERSLRLLLASGILLTFPRPGAGLPRSTGDRELATNILRQLSSSHVFSISSVHFSFNHSVIVHGYVTSYVQLCLFKSVRIRLTSLYYHLLSGLSKS